MRRLDPPDGFVDRVMARIPEKPSARFGIVSGSPLLLQLALRWSGAAHGSSTGVRLEGEKAKQELIYALTVASQSLQTTKHILTKVIRDEVDIGAADGCCRVRTTTGSESFWISLHRKREELG